MEDAVGRCPECQAALRISPAWALSDGSPAYYCFPCSTLHAGEPTHYRCVPGALPEPEQAVSVMGDLTG